MDKCIIDSCILDVEVLVNFAWVTRPEHPKGGKDEVKRPEGLQPNVGAWWALRLPVLR